MINIDLITFVCPEFEMNYFKFGNGKRPLVIIPGISLKPVSCSADAVANQYKLLWDTHTVYVFDRKKNIGNGYSVSDMADDTAKAMQKIGISDADILGTSQGGMIAQYIAIRYPKLVHKLVLCSSHAKNNDLSNTVFKRWVELSYDGNGVELTKCMSENVYSPSYIKKFGAAFEQLGKSVNDEDIRTFRILTEACLIFDCYDELDKIKCPVCVIASKCDNTLSGEASELIAEKINAKLIMYDGYSHAVYDEAPDFTQKLADFLNCDN